MVGTWAGMKTNTKKLLGYLSVGVLALGGIFYAYTHSNGAGYASWRRSGGSDQTGDSGRSVPAAGRLLSDESDVKALAARDARRVRSPAFIPGSLRDSKAKDSVERLTSELRLAAVTDRLKAAFPDTAPMGFWIRSAIALGTVAPEGELSPENFETIGSTYAQVLDGEESSVAALESGLQALPRSESSARRQAFRMLSDIGLKNRELRESVKSILLSEATRAGSHPDGALAFSSLLRMNPTKEWVHEVGRAYEKLHPGSELSDFVSLNVANL